MRCGQPIDGGGCLMTILIAAAGLLVILLVCLRPANSAQPEAVRRAAEAATQPANSPASSPSTRPASGLKWPPEKRESRPADDLGDFTRPHGSVELAAYWLSLPTRPGGSKRGSRT
jgi:hypothetical protein